MNKQLGNYNVNANLSSETLFHFTSSLEVLLSILEKGLQSRYVYEKLPGKKLAYITKTICFCDIPLGSIKEHINWYGDYGIGLNRPFAKANGFTPVLYIHSKSPEHPHGSSIPTLEWYRQFLLTKYLKQVRGKQIFYDNSGKPYWKWKTFYNEREWRYFPDLDRAEVIKYEVENDLEKKRKILNENDLPYFPISPEAIEYILIRDSKDLSRIIDVLKKNQIYKKYFELMLTKIITVKQILKDF